MSDSQPPPLVPAEVDLTDFQYMELDVQKLRDSKFAAEVDPEAFRAGVLLWCACWHQVPAGSLPNNDKELSALAGFGRVVKEWLKYREEALSLFTLCSDGRLYHRVIAEKAVSAWNSKLRHHYDRARDRLRKANKARETAKLPLLPEFTFDQWNEARVSKLVPMEKAEAADGIPPLPSPASAGIPPENALKENGKGKGEGTEKERNGDLKDSVPDGTDAAASDGPGDHGAGEPPPAATPPAPAPADPPKPKKAMTPEEREKSDIWKSAVLVLQQGGCKADGACRTFMGKLVQDYTFPIVREAVAIAVTSQPPEAREFLVATCQRLRGTRPGKALTAEQQRAESLAKADRLMKARAAGGGQVMPAADLQPAPAPALNPPIPQAEVIDA
mgnify:CR=1 FL=1